MPALFYQLISDKSPFFINVLHTNRIPLFRSIRAVGDDLSSTNEGSEIYDRTEKTTTFDIDQAMEIIEAALDSIPERVTNPAELSRGSAGVARPPRSQNHHDRQTAGTV
jgi:hypothetical protein